MALVNVRGQHSGLERFGIVLVKKQRVRDQISKQIMLEMHVLDFQKS